MTTWMCIIAIAFMLVNGVNTGGTLLSLGLTARAFPPWMGMLILAGGTILAPVIFGTAVATTVANELVVWSTADQTLGMTIAAAVSVVVVWVLSRMGAPTGLTLALVGAISGVGLAAGEPIGWRVIGSVLAMMALAPVAGGILAAGIVRGLAPRIQASDAGRALRRAHALAFATLALAYGTNDAQKMYAIFAIALAASTPAVLPVVWWHLLVVGGVFSLGAALGLRRMAATIGTGVIPARPLDVVGAEAGTAAAMLITGLLGAPVGLAQTVSGALIGSGAAHGIGRVRWQKAGALLVAWGTTLPAAAAGGALVGFVVFRV